MQLQEQEVVITIRFYPFSAFPDVSAVAMLTSVYEPLFASGVFDRKQLLQEWAGLDELALEVPDCFFFTRFGHEMAGFGSVDPRRKPEGIIGHHVVLPRFRGKGVGSAQLAEMERRLIDAGCTSAVADTGAAEFFAPARRLYSKNLYALMAVNTGANFKTFRYKKTLEQED